jgi:hypothetical protein
MKGLMQSTYGANGHVADWIVAKEIEPVALYPINFTFTLKGKVEEN